MEKYIKKIHFNSGKGFGLKDQIEEKELSVFILDKTIQTIVFKEAIKKRQEKVLLKHMYQ